MISKETKKHTKHVKLTKPIGGDFHTEEWGIIGAPCDLIKDLAQKLSHILEKEGLKTGFLDAAHSAPDKSYPYHLSYIDNIDYQTVNFDRTPSQKEYKRFFADVNILIVNGNHFISDRQIVIIDEKKKESLSRKLDRLTQVEIVIKKFDDQEIYDFLKPHITDNTRILNIDQLNEVTEVMSKRRYTIGLKGLVLAGGKSSRMGTDKSQLDYYGKPHEVYMAELLRPHCEEVFVSKRLDQGKSDDSNFPYLYDTFIGLGPYGAILSAFREYPNQAWLTVACDLPFMDRDAIQYLVENRNPNKLATCFYNEETQFPEPLVTIWEPKAYPVLLEYLSQAYSCPRKVLINSDVEVIKLENQRIILNANDKAAYDKALAEISEGG